MKRDYRSNLDMQIQQNKVTKNQKPNVTNCSLLDLKDDKQKDRFSHKYGDFYTPATTLVYQQNPQENTHAYHTLTKNSRASSEMSPWHGCAGK